MVLCRQPKTYKRLMRIMASQLIEHESMMTTKAKAKHLKKYANKVLGLARKAQKGETSPLNLLKGRIYTKKVQQKLLLDLMPRIKQLRGPLVNFTRVIQNRRGDNAKLVRISIKGNPYQQYQKRRSEEAIEKGQIPNLKAFSDKTLMEQKEFYEKKMEESPEQAEFFRQKIAMVEFEQWLNTKSKKQPPKYTLLV